MNETKTPGTRRRGKTGESKGSHGVFSRASSHEFLINYGGGKEAEESNATHGTTPWRKGTTRKSS